MSEPHLLVVAPHPDDETLGFGGSMYDHLRVGGSAEVIAVTDGEAADDRASDGERRHLVVRRVAERAAALRQLGGDDVEVARLGFPDGDVSGCGGDLERALRARFRTARRSHPGCVVVLPWRHDPHPDHGGTARAGLRAAGEENLAALEIPIWAWYRPGWRAVLPAARLRSLPLSREARAAKRAALRCFSSQLELLPGGRGPVLPEDFLEAFDCPFETVLV